MAAPAGPLAPPAPSTERFDPSAANLDDVGGDEVPPVNELGPREKVAFRVFVITAEIVVVALVMYFVLLLWKVDGDGFEKFGGTALSPVLTVFAGATGYYFGNRSSSES